MEDPQAPEELARIHEQLWQTVLQFGNFSASQERNRIARDLHDSLGQTLTALNIQLQTAVKLWQLDPNRAEQFLEEAQRLGSTAVQEVRQTVRTLRTDSPDDQSIETLITALVEGRKLPSFHWCFAYREVESGGSRACRSGNSGLSHYSRRPQQYL
ncbi:sensor histidine kinase [Leptodesmis sp.]|uniref:sensor histidine kinase n=1 Tax=Leptodesmis sp. TaxID=3100501 RepID=UPI0040535271